MLVRINIEPRWTIDHHEALIVIDDGELEGLDPAERLEVLRSFAEEYVNEECPWGFEEATDEEESTWR